MKVKSRKFTWQPNSNWRCWIKRWSAREITHRCIFSATAAMRAAPLALPSSAGTRLQVTCFGASSFSFCSSRSWNVGWNWISAPPTPIFTEDMSRCCSRPLIAARTGVTHLVFENAILAFINEERVCKKQQLLWIIHRNSFSHACS